MSNTEYNIKAWKVLLKRKLSPGEKKIIIGSRHEHEMNVKIDNVQHKINKIGFKISNLSGLRGNCMYESIGFNTGENYKIIKKKIHKFMKTFENSAIITGNDMTLKELFEVYNEIEFVKLNGVRTKYTFKLMVIDLLQKNGWQRMPTEILLNIVSRIYNKKIVIFRNENDNGYSGLTVIDNTVIQTEEPDTCSMKDCDVDNNSNSDSDSDSDEECESDSDSDEEIDENEDEIEMPSDYGNIIPLYDLEKQKLTYDIMCESIKLALIDECHYVPVNKINKNTNVKNIKVTTEYNEDIEKFKMFKAIAENEIKMKNKMNTNILNKEEPEF
jgi:hypothetical protein